MTLKLYHYVHCPFCVRVRLALGHLGLDYESVVTAYDDEETPVKLTGKKMLPILTDKGIAMNESLDIIQHLDKENRLRLPALKSSEEFKQLEGFLTRIGDPIHSLAMPFWIYTPEFTPSARAYFQKKKEVKRGPFKELYARRHEFQRKLYNDLGNIPLDLQPFYRSKDLSILDVMLASHLWGLYVVPEFQFSSAVHEYLQLVGKTCGFNYHGDFWK